MKVIGTPSIILACFLFLSSHMESRFCVWTPNWLRQSSGEQPNCLRAEDKKLKALNLFVRVLQTLLRKMELSRFFASFGKAVDMLKNNLLFNNKIQSTEESMLPNRVFWLTTDIKLKIYIKKNSTAVENSLMIPRKLNVVLPYDPIIPLLDKCTKNWKTGTETSTYTYMFTEVLFRIAKRLNNLSVH